MANPFYNDPEEKNEEPEKIKLGETEFTPDELQDLVGAGKKLKEIETKQGQPIDEILTSWGKRGERLGEWKKVTGAKKPDEFIKLKEAEKEKPPEQIDREKMKEQVINEAKEFGLVTKEELANYVKEQYQTWRSGEKLYSTVNKVLRQADKEGKPKASAEDLLKFMSDPANPKDPEKAYKLMFEKELDEWKAKKLESIKKPAMFTETKSTAGAKQPEFKVPSNREDLRNALSVHIRGESGGQ